MFEFLANLVLRLILLGGLIFIATTYIPQSPLPIETRVTIAAVVVVIYSLLETIASYLPTVKGKACEWVCGCNNGIQTSDSTDYTSAL